MTRPEALVEAALAAVHPSKPETLDAAFAVTAEQFPDSTPEQVLQALAARGHFKNDDIPSILKDSAREANAGLCVSCFGHVPTPIPPLPKPANLSHGRLNAGGAIVEVVEGNLGRRVVMSLPGESAVTEIEPLRLLPRVKAVAATSVLFAAMCVGVGVWPARWLSPLMFAFLLAWAGWGFYFLFRAYHSRWPRAERIAIDATWRELVPRIENRSILIRVCRISIGRGSISERAKPLRKLIETLAEESEPKTRTVQLLAAARVLQVFDGAEMGKDKVVGLAALFEPFFEGELPASFAEAIAQTILESGEILSGDLQRLRILVLAAAFETRYAPSDLPRLVHTLEFLRKLLKPLEIEALNEYYAVWRGLPASPGESAGTSASIFELARTLPTLSRKLLGHWPDALLRILMPESIQKGLGEVILTPRGLILDDLLIEESDATIEIERSPTGSGWYLAVGHHKVSVDRKPPLKIAEALAAWLDFRRTKLLPAARKEMRSNTLRLRHVQLQTLAECPWCGTVNSVRVGEVCEPLSAMESA